MKLREEVARAHVASKGWDWDVDDCSEDDGDCRCLSCFYNGCLTIPDVREQEREHADAAIALVLRKVEQHLSAVQYDPAPYTALKHRLAALTHKEPTQ